MSGSKLPPATSLRLARDIDLVHRIRQGDEAALRMLVYLYATWLIGVAQTVLEDADLAKDVVQDVFVHLWETRTQLNDQHTSVSAWLYRSVKNRAINHNKRERRHARIAQELKRDNSANPSVENAGALSIERAEFRGVFNQALYKLPPRMREIFLMRAVQDMSPAEIAETLGVVSTTVYAQLYRATKMLAAELRGWMDPPGPEPSDK